jgi:TonB family protein
VRRRLAAAFVLAVFWGRAAFGADDNQSKSKAESTKAEAAKSEDGKVYEIGPDVQSPKLLHVVEPEFDPKSETAFTSGVVRLQVVVTTEGNIRDPKVLAGINDTQNKKAIEAAEKWKFKPGTREGKPVNVRVVIELQFHLL